MYLYGGFLDGAAVGDLYKFEISMRNFQCDWFLRFIETGKWTVLEKGKKRCNHTMTAVGKSLYIFGGRANGTTLYNDVAVYDTGTGERDLRS